MKKIIFTGLVAFSFLVVSCNSTKKDSENLETNTTAEMPISDGHNAENSLDIAGVYKGVLPCADCEGIQTTIVLNDDNTYKLTTLYQTDKKGDNEFVENGKWSIAVNTLTLENAVKNGEPHMKYFVGENTLTQLDLDGNKIEGALAEHYILRK